MGEGSYMRSSSLPFPALVVHMPSLCLTPLQVDKILGPGNQFVTAAKMVLQNSEAMVSPCAFRTHCAAVLCFSVGDACNPSITPSPAPPPHPPFAALRCRWPSTCLRAHLRCWWWPTLAQTPPTWRPTCCHRRSTAQTHRCVTYGRD